MFLGLTVNAQMNGIGATAVENKPVIDSAQLNNVAIPIAQQKKIEVRELKRDIQDINSVEQLKNKVETTNTEQIKAQAKVEAKAKLLEDKARSTSSGQAHSAGLGQVEGEKQTFREVIKSKIEATKENVIRTASQIKSKAMSNQRLTSEKAREVIQKAQEERAIFKSKVMTLKVEIQDRRKVEKEELQNKVQFLKNQKKREAVMRIDNSLNNLNSRFVEKWSEALNKLDEWTIKIIDKIAVESANDKDVSGANKAIDDAKAVMLSARTAIENQLGKTYPIAITTEDNLKSDVSAVRIRLNTDLKSIKDSIQEAHKSVVNALVEFNKIIK